MNMKTLNKEKQLEEATKSLNWWAKRLNVWGIPLTADENKVIDECNRILPIIFFHDNPEKMPKDWAKFGMRCYEVMALAYDLKELKEVE